MMPSSVDLTYFMEVASTLNLSRASERLGISQPSLSLAVQRLENSLGVPLLVRSQKGVTLTQAGQQVVVHTRDLLQRWDALRGRALASVHDVQGCFVLGCHPSVALYSLPGFLPDLMENHRRLEIKLVHDLSRRIAERVIRTEIDLGIVVNPVRHPDLVIRKLCDDHVTFWTSKKNKPLQDLNSGEAILICDSDLLQTQHLLQQLKKSGLQFGRMIPTSSLEVITRLTAAGAGVGIIPGRVADGANLQRVPRAPVFKDEICLLYRVENKGVRAIQAFVDAISASFLG